MVFVIYDTSKVEESYIIRSIFVLLGFIHSHRKSTQCFF
jgi:hypothetical protein